VEFGAGYCLHLINCFEAGDRLTMDILELEEPVYRQYQPIPDLFSDAPPCKPVRYEIDLRSKTLVERISMSYDRTPDFPSLDTARAGSSYNDFWMLGIHEAGQRGRKFFDELAHGSWKRGQVADVFQLPSGEYMGGEPVFVSNPHDPEDAVVIVQRHQPAIGATSFLLFDAFAVAKGPLATLPLRNRLHAGFHASFSKSSLEGR
jgi:carotenoid cleavage dioxygenase-like enzyme